MRDIDNHARNVVRVLTNLKFRLFRDEVDRLLAQVSETGMLPSEPYNGADMDHVAAVIADAYQRLVVERDEIRAVERGRPG